MRWMEVVESLTGDLKTVVGDLLIPLRDNGLDRVSIRQIKGEVEKNPLTRGIDIDDDFLSQTLRDSGLVDRVEDDPQTNLLTAFFNPETPESSEGEEEEKVDKDVVKQAKKLTKGS